MVSPIVAAIISFFFPGIGQIIQCETQKGIIMFVVFAIICILHFYVGGMFWIVSLIYSIYTAYDAYNNGY